MLDSLYTQAIGPSPLKFFANYSINPQANRPWNFSWILVLRNLSQNKYSKILSDPPFEALFEKVSKNNRKKVVGLKNDSNKSCLKFCKLGGDFFFLFDEISKNTSEGRKKSLCKKSHKIKKWQKQKLSEILQIRCWIHIILMKSQKWRCYSWKMIFWLCTMYRYDVHCTSYLYIINHVFFVLEPQKIDFFK